MICIPLGITFLTLFYFIYLAYVYSGREIEEILFL